MRDGGQQATETVKASVVRAHWGRILREVFSAGKRVVVGKNGVPVAAIVSIDDLRRLEGLDGSLERDLEALRATREAFKDVPDRELAREVNRAFREARERYRKKGPLKRRTGAP